MTKFSLEVIAYDEKVVMSFPGGRSVVIAQSSDGAVFSPMWNNRHFTWADNDADVPMPHVRNETTDEKIAETRYDSQDAFETDMYSGMTGIGKPKPINWVPGDHLWALDTEAYGDMLEKHGIIERSEDRLWVGFESFQDYLEHLMENEDELLEFLDRVYDPVEFEGAAKSDDRLFFTEELESFVLQRPDGYVIVLSMTNPVNIFERMRSVRTIDVMYQMFDGPTLSV